MKSCKMLECFTSTKNSMTDFKFPFYDLSQKNKITLNSLNYETETLIYKV